MILRQFLHTDPIAAKAFVAHMLRDVPEPPPRAAATRAADLG